MRQRKCQKNSLDPCAFNYAPDVCWNCFENRRERIEKLQKLLCAWSEGRCCEGGKHESTKAQDHERDLIYECVMKGVNNAFPPEPKK